MSEHEQEQEQTDAVTGEDETHDGDELTDAEQGVGIAPTQAGDVGPDDEGEGTPFRPSSDFEDAADDGDDSGAA